MLTTQHLDELEGYRTDAHSTAWMTHNVAGHTWDAFSHPWRNGAFALDQRHITFQYNEVTRGVYAADLLGLANQGLVDAAGRTLMGFSWGGGFALYTLFHQPHLFQSYIVGSQDLLHGNGAVLTYELIPKYNHCSLVAPALLAGLIAIFS